MVQQLRSSRNALRLGGGVALALSVVLASVSPVKAQSLTDRFKSLFGGTSDEPAQPKPPPAPGQSAEDELDCPQVTVRSGASTYAVGAAGKPAAGNEVRFQASITKMARECVRSSDGITARIGIQGRVIAGPAGAPASVEVPLRFAVVQGGVGEKVIASKAYRTTVDMTPGGSVPFTFVIEDMTYPVPSPAVADNYIFYVGFDPQALSPEPKGRKKK
ncbi:MULTISPECIES: hypothetical protein [Bradyrhizobium]|uniref:Uncharacterized protein n=1 Tax=Bradyrhizobium frederickii TaxID=2560054 RepID=A0A4Y9L139_9BRAD|nr:MULTISPECIES: hypothetical protein [Bradyrhizobium]RTE89171.1 hypothetical protein D6B98_32545 [Bradyrhizobium sp. LVM 105]TFV35944.1 hypothetical protein E4K66_24475 [Bradyrhizobium frederickii]